MSIRGSCECKNIEVVWHTIDHSLVPRACQCGYCRSKEAAYVTKSGTRFEVVIHNEKLHTEVRHGSETAVFHECSYCGQVVFVTAEIDGELFGALNANQLSNKYGFAESVKLNFSAQSVAQKRERWRENWCHPVLITSKGTGRSKAAPVL